MVLNVSCFQASCKGSGPGDEWSQDGCGHSGRSVTDRGSSRQLSDGDHPWSVSGEGLRLHQDGDEVRQHGDVPLDPRQVHRGLYPGEQRSFYHLLLLLPKLYVLSAWGITLLLGVTTAAPVPKYNFESEWANRARHASRTCTRLTQKRNMLWLMSNVVPYVWHCS